MDYKRKKSMKNYYFSTKKMCVGYDNKPLIKDMEIKLREETYVFPKVEFGKPNQDQEPTLDRDLYRRLMEM